MEHQRLTNVRKARTGDNCESCEQGRYFVSKSVPSEDGSWQIKTLRCKACGHYHSCKCVVPADEVRRRSRD